MKTLSQCWQDYRQQVYPEEIPAAQEAETHQAFFAGALMTTLILQSLATLPDDEAAEALEKLVKEARTICRLRSIVLDLRAAKEEPNAGN